MVLFSLEKDTLVWSVWRSKANSSNLVQAKAGAVPSESFQDIWYFYSPSHKIYLRLHQGKEESWKLIDRHQIPFAIRVISEKKNSVDELERDRLGS